MLLCNNTAFRAETVLPLRSARPILATMSEADELARRFLALWSDYLTALLSDPKAAEPLLGILRVAGGRQHQGGKLPL